MSSISNDMTPIHASRASLLQEKSRPSLILNNRVVILCSTLWSIRNVVLSGLLDRLKSRGVKPFILIGKNLGHTLPEASTAAEGHSLLLDAPIVKATHGKPLLDALLHASFARRYQISSYPIFNRWLKQNKTSSQRLKG